MSNKDEALRAKDLAEDWMRKADFTTARRVAMKAQKMDSSLENVVARMIMVCDVHCAALEKSGDEIDWYKILQVELNADDNTIKKQYRKFALHLHPDKNTLPGAESAFKTVGEAQRVLLDKEKRRVHDMRRKPFRKPAQAPAPAPSFRPQQYHTPPVFQTNVNVTRNSFTMGSRPENQQTPQAQPTESSGDQRFWTSCAFCHMKYEYDRRFINKPVKCLKCNKQYIAFKAFFQGPPVEATFSFSQQSKVPIQEAGIAVEKQAENSARISIRKECTRAKISGTSAEDKNGEKKRKMTVGSSDGCNSDSRNKCEEVANGGQHYRRSVRSKQQVSYKENKNDGDIKEEDAKSVEETGLRKKSHENHLFAGTLPNGINRIQVQAGSSAKGSSSGSSSDLEVFECADLDFTDFEKSREESCFRPGQVWAMYDPGRMPRYYAIITKVTKKPKFMLKMTWLESDPDDEKAKQWVHKKLPVSVGKFELGGEDETSETPSFSHLVHTKVRSMKDTVTVYPRIGETWALFKNWDINWSSGCRRSSHKHKYEYECVEILSEYAEGVAIEVAFLWKVKGFASVFCRIAPGGRSKTSRIPPHELLRFSHNIPSTKLTGKERNGVPVGSYELDTAALPQKVEELEAIPVSQEAAKSNHVHRGSPPSPQPDCVIIPSYQFHKFSDDRKQGKFAMGQIWSLNCKEDGLPKYYAMIQKIIWMPFTLHIKLLEPEALPVNVTQWRDKKMPVSVGNFTLMESKVEILTEVTRFSHQIKAHQHIIRKNRYTVLPKTGEIWAMYKNWSETIKVASLKKCEYEVVEVLDDNERHIEVMMLERMKGFLSVFKEKMEGGIDVKKKIPRCELLRFSHYVPAFRLTGERNGTLRGCLELDVTALSRNLRRS